MEIPSALRLPEHYRRIMPTGLRGVHYLAELAGARMVFSLQPRVQRMVNEADLPKVERINEEIPEGVISRLRRIPEFVRAYEESGMTADEFVTFGVTQKDTFADLMDGVGAARKLGRQYKIESLVLMKGAHAK